MWQLQFPSKFHGGALNTLPLKAIPCGKIIHIHPHDGAVRPDMIILLKYFSSSSLSLPQLFLGPAIDFDGQVRTHGSPAVPALLGPANAEPVCTCAHT